ncbi:MAG: TIGR03435 family protein [Acidobacteriota bacterium]
MGFLTGDSTGIEGKYDFEIDVAPASIWIQDSAPGADPPLLEPFPDFEFAMEKQLGLHIEHKTGPVDVIAVDRAERAPTEN